MSKMKHLLRKLHIGGGGLTGHQRLEPVNSISPPPASSIESGRAAVSDAATSTCSTNGGADFSFLEEEFQVQLALAISASDPDVDASRIDTSNRTSLSPVPLVPSSNFCSSVPFSVAESLALRYWRYNVVNYNEKMTDGFYDVHSVSSSSVVKGSMPSMKELQALSLAQNFEYEVVLVNRGEDPQLEELEKEVKLLSLRGQDSQGLEVNSLVQKLADIVVNRMGGPVGDADEMSRMWKMKNLQLQKVHKTIVLPLGCLDLGLSRHRALLFKVLADEINLPCMLVKGSYYTGTDDGAVNMIQLDDGCEYIIDLMGAPGTLIPVEVPSSHIVNGGFAVSCFSCLTDSTECPVFQSDDNPGTSSSRDALAASDLLKSEGILVAKFDPLDNSVEEMSEQPAENFHMSSNMEDHDSDCNLRRRDVMKISMDKQFGGKKFCDTSTECFSSTSLVDCWSKMDGTDLDMLSSMPRRLRENGILHSALQSAECPKDFSFIYDDDDHAKDGISAVVDSEVGKNHVLKIDELERCNRVLREGADCEILWENLQIGERIGIGSYGEVYRAELNGTEVAVKKFLDQDFSGDALMQFRCEIEIMLRLRHPNVVLFMGAVTRPPNLSILTEFLPRGSLYKLLHRSNSGIDDKKRLRMALDVAKGMNYLHTIYPTVVHRDLKSPNLLVDHNWVVKVCDFGLSRLKHNTFLSSKSTAGTPEWMAPEVLRNEPANEKCDIYSFGVILWELATSQVPWKDLNPMQVVGAVGFQNRRLEIPENIDPTVAQIIQDCWQMEPHLRPSFAQLIPRLRRVQRLCF